MIKKGLIKISFLETPLFGKYEKLSQTKYDEKVLQNNKEVFTIKGKK